MVMVVGAVVAVVPVKVVVTVAVAVVSAFPAARRVQLSGSPGPPETLSGGEKGTRRTALVMERLARPSSSNAINEPFI